jgi:hypothetical protein
MRRTEGVSNLPIFIKHFDFHHIERNSSGTHTQSHARQHVQYIKCNGRRTHTRKTLLQTRAVYINCHSSRTRTQSHSLANMSSSQQTEQYTKCTDRSSYNSSQQTEQSTVHRQKQLQQFSKPSNTQSAPAEAAIAVLSKTQSAPAEAATTVHSKPSNTQSAPAEAV